MSYHAGKFTWFEHLSADPAKAREFYEKLFGWKVETLSAPGRDYDMVQNGGEGIAGLLRAPSGVPTHWASYLSVTDVDASFDAALAAGAKALMPPSDFAGVGRGATFADPTGAVVSLWKGLQGDRPDRDPTPAGDWIWNELLTPDVNRSLAFYEGLFGYTHDEMRIGDGATYYILKSPDGKPRAGLMKTPHADTPPMWLPYVRVEEADATAARVAPLGGSLTIPPQDVPTVGRLGALVDPQGAAIAFIQPAVMA
ncbi:VOC family protein [Ramlibacter sp. WS9]|uniref:VOC family protein n=1 Tax=Ramlibacter sp. WS9 TaxID=1882741 RepID=UPI0013053DCC|nr:VOC family protein [Ramlibacter sp. WS9]